MNKQLEDGKRLAERLNQKCKNFTFEKVGHSDGSFSYELNGDGNFIAIREREFDNLHNALRFSRFYSHHSPEKMLEIYAHIEKLEALKNLAQDIVTHPCWLVNSEIPKSLKARRDLYVEAWNALEESE